MKRLRKTLAEGQHRGAEKPLNNVVILPIEGRAKLREIKRIERLCEANCGSARGKLFFWAKEKEHTLFKFLSKEISG